ncbi:ATP-binding protein [candidate division KSB1 bacterium]|nr:ATP-binding protein [candidate division KSB1 bacterium]
MAGIKLHPELRRNLLLIAKEALHNAVKYSGSPSVAVKFETNGKHLVVEVADCGKGFDLASAKNGNGLNNIRSRAEKLGGSCEIISAPGQGTRVTARVPYK